MGSRNSKGRMIYWKISYSKQLIRCSTFSQLLFTWIIPNTDDLGRMEGDPEIIKGMIFPYHTNVTVKQIRDALKEISEQGLIIWYKVGENLYIELPNFAIYQKLRNDRAYKSDYPSPGDSDSHCQDLSGQDTTSPSEVNGSEGEENRSESIYPPDFEKWYLAYPYSKAKADTFKSFKKVRKDKGMDYIWTCTNNYLDYLERNPKKKDFPYSSNNFLGEKQYCQDFEKTTEKGQATTADKEAIDSIRRQLEGKTVSMG